MTRFSKVIWSFHLHPWENWLVQKNVSLKQNSGKKPQLQISFWQVCSTTNLLLKARVKEKFLQSVFPKSVNSCRGTCPRAACRLTPLPIKVLSHQLSHPGAESHGPPGKAQGRCSAWWDTVLGQMGRSDCRSPSSAPNPHICLSLLRLSLCITTHVHPPHYSICLF